MYRSVWTSLILCSALVTDEARADLAQEYLECARQQIKEIKGSGRFEGDHRVIFNMKRIFSDEVPNFRRFCRNLGKLSPDLRFFWPSTAMSYDVISDGSISSEVLKEISSATEHSLTLLRDEFGAEVSGQLEIVVASSNVTLWELWRGKHPDRDRISFDEAFQKSCHLGFSGAFSDFYGVAICARPSSVEESISEIQTAALASNVAHEIFHFAQFDAIGVDRYFANSNLDTIRGPLWLLEGSAEYFSFRDDIASHDMVEFSKYLWDNSGARVSSFADAIGGEVVDSTYYLASLNVLSNLIYKHDEREIIGFYERLGHGGDWKVHFEGAFGVGPNLTEYSE